LACPRNSFHDDGCIPCNEIFYNTFGSTSQEDHDVQIAVRTRVELPQNCYIMQIPGHTNYARSVRQPFPSNTALRFSREMAVATVGPFQMLCSLCVIDTYFTILRHFLLKLWHNEIHPVFWLLFLFNQNLVIFIIFCVGRLTYISFMSKVVFLCWLLIRMLFRSCAATFEFLVAYVYGNFINWLSLLFRYYASL
jgi:hypothetical protein